jgi:hypothetical protein
MNCDQIINEFNITAFSNHSPCRISIFVTLLMMVLDILGYKEGFLLFSKIDRILHHFVLCLQNTI